MDDRSEATPHLVLIGAGMTGRGQVAQLAHDAGWRLTLVDKDSTLVRLLTRAGAYTVRLLSAAPREVTISGYAALQIDDAPALATAVADADLVVTSVLEPNLPDVARALAPALAHRLRTGASSPLHVVAAENMACSSTVLGGHVRRLSPPGSARLLAERVAFPDSMIARVVPVSTDPLCIAAEAFSEWTADRLATIGEPPSLAGLEWVDNQGARLQRKLYIHNTGHVVCAALGWLAGFRYIHEAARDARVMSHIARSTEESGSAIAAAHGFDRAEITAYEANLRERLVIAEMPDEIRRVIRQPIRKLGLDERLLGPLRMCEELDLPRDSLCHGVAALLRCRVEGDEQFDTLSKVVTRHGPIGALGELVGYAPGRRSAQAIEQSWRDLG